MEWVYEAQNRKWHIQQWMAHEATADIPNNVQKLEAIKRLKLNSVIIKIRNDFPEYIKCSVTRLDWNIELLWGTWLLKVSIYRYWLFLTEVWLVYQKMHETIINWFFLNSIVNPIQLHEDCYIVQPVQASVYYQSRWFETYRTVCRPPAEGFFSPHWLR